MAESTGLARLKFRQLFFFFDPNADGQGSGEMTAQGGGVLGGHELGVSEKIPSCGASGTLLPGASRRHGQGRGCRPPRTLFRGEGDDDGNFSRRIRALQGRRHLAPSSGRSPGHQTTAAERESTLRNGFDWAMTRRGGKRVVVS